MEVATKQTMELPRTIPIDSTQCVTNRLLLGRGRDRAVAVEADIFQATVNLRSSSVTHAKSKGI